MPCVASTALWQIHIGFYSVVFHKWLCFILEISFIKKMNVCMHSVEHGAWGQSHWASYKCITLYLYLNTNCCCLNWFWWPVLVSGNQRFNYRPSTISSFLISNRYLLCWLKCWFNWKSITFRSKTILYTFGFLSIFSTDTEVQPFVIILTFPFPWITWYSVSLL